jgi:hypothetical protein
MLGRELRKTHSTQLSCRLAEQPAQLGDSDAFALMRLRYSSTYAPGVNVAERRSGTSRASLF